MQLSLVQLENLADNVVDVHRLELRLRHFGEVAEAPDNGLQVAEFSQQGRGALAKHFVEFGGIARAQQVFHRDLQREERILELVRQAAGKFAPGGDALGLHGAVALFDQLVGHGIERFGELADFVARGNFDVRVPIAGGDFPRGFGQTFDGLRDARRHPAAEQNREQDSDAADDEREGADMPLQLDQAAA